MHTTIYCWLTKDHFLVLFDSYLHSCGDVSLLWLSGHTLVWVSQWHALQNMAEKPGPRFPTGQSLWCAYFILLLWLGKANSQSDLKKPQKVNTDNIEWVMGCSWLFTTLRCVHMLIFWTIELQVLLWMTLVTCNRCVWYCFSKV